MNVRVWGRGHWRGTRCYGGSIVAQGGYLRRIGLLTMGPSELPPAKLPTSGPAKLSTPHFCLLHLLFQIHTPDSSRYWISDTYLQRHAQGLEPENIDKEFLRLWFRSVCDPYKDKVGTRKRRAPVSPDASVSQRSPYLFHVTECQVVCVRLLAHCGH